MVSFDPQAGRPLPGGAERTAAENDSDDHDVTVALSGLSELVSDVDDLSDVLTQIAGFALAAVPGAHGTGVTLTGPGEDTPAAQNWSFTAEFVRQLEHLQYEVCREGPCLTAMLTRRPLVSGSLGADVRWPSFGGRAARLSVHSALALPLVVRDTVVGAINVYAHQRDAFTEHAVALGERFAGPSAVAVHNTRKLQAARQHAAHLSTALVSRTVIDQAIGVIRSRSGVTETEAFDRLRQLSQAGNVKLSVVAQQLMDEAVRRAHARPRHS